MLFAAEIEEELSQGDVFRSGWDKDREANACPPVLVLSEECEIDKAPTVLVADVEAEATTEGGLWSNLIGGRVWHALYLPGCAEPGWANLRKTHPVPKEQLIEVMDRRLHSMTPMGRDILAGKYHSFLTHSLPPTHTYFRDSQGVVWDVWGVSAKQVGRYQTKVRGPVPAEFATGWLVFSCYAQHRRLAPVRLGWQYASDAQYETLCSLAAPADMTDVACLAIEQGARAEARIEHQEKRLKEKTAAH